MESRGVRRGSKEEGASGLSGISGVPEKERFTRVSFEVLGW